VIRETEGKGADVLFALKNTNGRTVVFLDQRERFLGTEKGLPATRSLLSNARSTLIFLPVNSIAILCMFNCTVIAQIWGRSLPFNHPAVMPFVDVNSAPLTIITKILNGLQEEIETVARNICSRRNFKDLFELEMFIKKTNERFTLKHDTRGIVMFTE
jgi:hypothetical protein